MSTSAPQVLSRRTNGVHPAELSAKGKAAGRGKGASDRHSEVKSTTNDAEAAKPSRTKAPAEGDKVVIRRLPPGMTETEFVSILGPEWEAGKGKVDWFSYRPGKVSNDPSKPSRPARAYLHLTRKEYIMPLSDLVRHATWEDAKCTFTNPSLIGPPALEFSIYKKVPGTKKRTDARQGTIDQDPEFMAFLESLANPTPPRESIDIEDGEDAAESKVTTTPLIEYLKEKKANKAKEASSVVKNAKHTRQEAAPATKGKGAAKEDDGSKKKGKESKGTKSDKAVSKEPVKILIKKAATEQAAEAAKNVSTQMGTANSNTTANANANASANVTATATTTTNASASANFNANTNASTTEAPAPKSRRAGIAAAARILQRDLGLSPGSAHRRARQDAAKAEADSKASTSNKKEPATASKEATPPAPAPAAETTTSSQPTKAQPTTTAATAKSQATGRRNRGGKNADKGKATDTATAQAPTVTPPVILKKKSHASGDAEAQKAATETASTLQQQSSSNARSAPNGSNGVKGGSSKSSSSQKKPAAVSPSATRGFVKHANPSQGVTEAVLKQALEVFGSITFVEMDKRKGFAYVDFADHAGLAKAISASPITVAQGTVQVLERKDKKPAAGGGSTGGGGGGGGTVAAASTGGSNAATAGGPTNSAAAEKSSGRGRRGRGGGGGKGNAAANGNQTATAASTTTAAAASTNGASSSTANGGG